MSISESILLNNNNNHAFSYKSDINLRIKMKLDSFNNLSGKNYDIMFYFLRNAADIPPEPPLWESTINRSILHIFILSNIEINNFTLMRRKIFSENDTHFPCSI